MQLFQKSDDGESEYPNIFKAQTYPGPRKEKAIFDKKTHGEVFLEKVLYPFIPQITSRNIKVYFCRNNSFDLNMQADWTNY